MGAELDAAVTRLQASLGFLETAVGRHFAGDRRSGDLETELQIMGDDRARLAVDLESATARLATVESVAAHVEGRVQNAIGALQDVLAVTEPQDVDAQDSEAEDSMARKSEAQDGEGQGSGRAGPEREALEPPETERRPTAERG